MRPCKSCGELFQQYNSVQNLCFACTRQKYLTTPQKKRKAIPWKGKVTEKWIEYRADWFERFPPDKDGNYVCGICKKKVHKDETTLDHIQPRSGNPELRFEDNNIVPAHFLCNSIKGSRRYPTDSA